MSAKESIGRLQDLLERVQARAASPRGNGASHAAQVAFVAPAAAEQAAPTTPPPYAEPEPVEEVMSSAPVTPPMAEAPVDLSRTAEASYDADTDADVEISTETIDIDIDIDEPMPMESGAQPIAQQTMPPEDLEDEVEEAPMATQPSVRPPVHAEAELEEVTQATAPANEIEEPTPSSSRRPIAGEEPAAEAYEEESAPRHTPPPESGKQVAAPSAHPPSHKPSKASVPPPSLEGHTLIGGWREPGLGVPRGAPPVAGGTEPPATIANVPQASGTRLTADVTRPELAAGEANVAAFHGASPVPKPTTLGELLDLTLGL